MKRDKERGRNVEPAGEVRETAEARRPWPRPRTRVVCEAAVAAIPAEGEAGAAAPAEASRRPRTRVVAEAVVAAIPEAGPAEGADAEAGAGA
jgi:hypothetical protein